MGLFGGEEAEPATMHGAGKALLARLLEAEGDDVENVTAGLAPILAAVEFNAQAVGGPLSLCFDMMT